MSILKFVALMFGSGAAMAKSSYDLRKKANDPSVKAALEDHHEKYDPVPMKKGYKRTLEFDLIHKKIRDNLDAIALIEEEFRQKGVEQEKLREMAQQAWLYRNARDYYDAYYSYREYVVEWARKTVWNSGYMPVSGRPYKRSKYNVPYTGKDKCVWPLDFTSGIPDQEFRHLLSIADSHYPYELVGIELVNSPYERDFLRKIEEKDRIERDLFEPDMKEE